MSEPTYTYVKGQGWVPTIKTPPKDWEEQCARVCPTCHEQWGDHFGWSCYSRSDSTKSEWPEEDRWVLIPRPSLFR